ncbi:hypothetical protein A2U01_0095077, partial [Trifolium medium]|nr:hypothetical protein [Trifolium medium]
SIPIFFMSFMKMPALVIKKVTYSKGISLERGERWEETWLGQVEGGVSREEEGGLGVRDFA